ncbi:MAG: hypothetical protein JWP63_5869 [Candidatus Solibacter sp.]|nr:hypothetical protein [Candidatus Solibacter sp.]
MLSEFIISCFTVLSHPGDGPPQKPPLFSPLPPPFVKPAPAAITTPQIESVDWSGLGRSSSRLLGVMHGFRWLTEPGTRAAGFGIGSGYTRSVTNLHGWADGDPFYVNYVGHPMQGAVAGRIFSLHDPKYAKAEFGRGRTYWKAKLRSAAFAWAFSEQFEIGLVSEASIGHIQRDFPQQGFVDHVVTPTIGLSWTIAEDAVDRFIIRPIEDRTTNPWVRMLVRSFLSPARSFANMMDMRVPWYRDSRTGVLAYTPSSVSRPAAAETATREQYPAIAPFEFAVASAWRQFDGKPCIGGSADAAYRVASDWQIALAVNGCKMLGLPANTSADSLAFQLGPRWTPMPAGKWSPYAHLLVGGMKLTQEVFDPAKKRAVLEANKDLDPALDYTLHGQYTTLDESSFFAVTAGMGLDYKLNSALAIRVANFEYLRSGARNLGGVVYNNGFQMTTGMVVRLGTW